MHPLPPEIPREEVVHQVRVHFGVRITPYQLLRWHDAGLLPQPRRTGLGRARGTTSLYPTVAFLQAGMLAWFLKHRARNLRDAGWYLWAFGFDVTPFVRGMFIEELTERERTLRREYERFRRGAKRTAFAQLATRRVRGLERMRKVFTGEELIRVLRMMTELQLGQLHQEPDYTVNDWEDLQAAIITEFQPGLARVAGKPTDYDFLTDPDLPTAGEVKVGLGRLSREENLPRVIQALKVLDDRWLCVIRNEAQAFYARLGGAFGLPQDALIDRGAFLDYFKSLYVSRSNADALKALRQAMGWTRPPLSPLQQLAQRQRTSDHHPSSTEVNQ